MTTMVPAVEGRPPQPIDPTRAAPIGWRITIVCALVGLLDRIEGTLVAGALSNIQKDLSISDTQAGFIPTGAAIAGLLLVIPAGRLADRHRRGRLLGAIVAAWSVFTLGTSLATGFAAFFGMRMLLGACSQLDNPAVSSLIADAHPGRGRARAFGIERAAYYSGLPLGLVLGGVLAGAFGWRTAFVVAAAPGALVAVACWLLPEPVRGLGDRLDQLAADSGEPVLEAPVDTDAPPVPPTRDQLRALLRVPTLRVLCVGMPILFLGIGGLFYWLPSYLERSLGVTEEVSGALSGGAGFTGILIGIGLGSAYGDRFHRRIAGWRVWFGGLGVLGGAGALAFTLVAPGLPAKATGVVLANVGFSLAIPNLTAAVADVLRPSDRGMGFATLQFLLTAGGAAGPGIVGVVSDTTGSLGLGLGALAVPMFVGAGWILRGRAAYEADLTS